MRRAEAEKGVETEKTVAACPLQLSCDADLPKSSKGLIRGKGREGEGEGGERRKPRLVSRKGRAR